MVISTLIADVDPLRQPWKPGEPLPTLIKVLRFGHNPGVKGDFVVTERTLANLAANQKARGRDHVVIDCNHNTVPGTRAYAESTEPRPVLARKATVVVTPDRCIALQIDPGDWTKEGREGLGYYADFSPAIVHPKDSLEVVAIDSAGGVRNGSTDGLTFCSADGSAEVNKEDEMKDLLAALIAAKLLPEGADEAAAVKLVVDMLSAMKTQMTELSADKIKILTTEVAKGQITALSTEVDTLKKGREADRKAMIRDRAFYEGKVIQLDDAAITALSVEQLEAHVAKLAVTVPLEQRTKTTPAGADPDPKVNPERDRIARICGNDPAVVYKSK